MSPKRVPHVDLSYLPKCTHFFRFQKKKEPALQNFRPLTGPCVEGSNRQILAKQVLLKNQVLVLACFVLHNIFSCNQGVTSSLLDTLSHREGGRGVLVQLWMCFEKTNHVVIHFQFGLS